MITRLKKRQQFVNVSRARNTVRTETVWVQCGKAFDKEPFVSCSKETVFKVGFTASKKVGNAIKRNRSKRRLRAIIDTLMIKIVSKTPALSVPINFVFIALPQTIDCPYDSLVKDVEKGIKLCLKRLKNLESC